jgi:hypothetical protein
MARHSQRTARDYANEALARFPDLDEAVAVLIDWARHDVELARALEVQWLDLVAPVSESLKARVRSMIQTAFASRPENQPIPETKEQVEAREAFVRNFRW